MSEQVSANANRLMQTGTCNVIQNNYYVILIFKSRLMLMIDA